MTSKERESHDDNILFDLMAEEGGPSLALENSVLSGLATKCNFPLNTVLSLLSTGSGASKETGGGGTGISQWWSATFPSGKYVKHSLTGMVEESIRLKHHPNLTSLFEATPGGEALLATGLSWGYPPGVAASGNDNNSNVRIWSPFTGQTFTSHYEACASLKVNVATITELLLSLKLLLLPMMSKRIMSQVVIRRGVKPLLLSVCFDYLQSNFVGLCR